MRALWISLVALGLMVAAPAGALSILGFKNAMVEFLLDQISVEGELVVKAEIVEEPEEGVTAIRGLTVADSQGVWMTVESLDFAWNPSRLLRGEVEFQNLSMSGVRVLRPPVAKIEAAPAPVEAEAPGSLIPEIAWPRSPLTVRIERMALSDVEIAEPVFGQSLAFDAEGAARDEGDVQSARLDLVRTDAIRGRIAFDYSRNFSDSTLALNLNADEAAGGLVALLAGLPEDAPSELSLSASGPPEDWVLTLKLALAEIVAAEGRAALSYAGPLSVDADFSLSPGAKLDPEIAALIGERARLVARVAEEADGTIRIAEAALTSPNATLTADGTYARPTGAADLTVDLLATAGLAAPFPGVDFEEVGFKGRVTSPEGGLAATGQLRLAGLRTDAVDVAAAELVTDFRQGGPEGAQVMELALNGALAGLRLDRIAAEVIGEARAEVALTLAGDALALETAWIDSAVLALSASGTADIATGDAEIGLGLSTPDLARVAAAYGVDAAGRVEMTGEVKRAGGATRLDATARIADLAHALADARTLGLTVGVDHTDERIAFTLDAEGEALRLDRIPPTLLPRATVGAVGMLEGDALTIELLTLASPLIQAQAAGTLDLADQSGAVTYRVDAPALGPVAEIYEMPLAGRLAASGRAELPAADAAAGPRLDGDLAIAGLVWDGTAYGDAKARHDVVVSEAPSGQLELTLDGGPYSPARASTRFALAGARLDLAELDAEVAGLGARGALAIDLDATLLDGDLALQSGDLGRLAPIIGTRLAGSAEARLGLATEGGRQDARIDLTATRFGAEGVTAGRLRIRTGLRDLFGPLAIDGTAEAAGLAIDDVRFETTRLSARGPLSALDVTLDAKGTLDEDALGLSTAGRLDLAGEAVRARIARLEATLGDERVALAGPASVTVSGAVVAARGLDVLLPSDGRVSGDVTYFGGPMAGDLTLALPDLAVLKRLADLPVAAGSAEARARFDTRGGRAFADATVAGRDVRFEGIDVAGGLGLDARVDWKGATAAVDATVSGDFGEPLRVSARLPMRAGGALPDLARRGPVSGSIAWSGEIGDLWALVPLSGHVLTGRAEIDLGVSGDIADPALTGSVGITDGGYQNLDLGTILTDLALATELSQGGELGIRLTATDGADGTVTSEGTVALDASGLDLKTTIERAVLVRRDDVTARIGGEVVVKGALDELAVNGRLVIEEAEVRLVNSNPPSIITLGEVTIKGAPVPEKTEAAAPVALAIDVEAPGRLFVRGRGLDSEWKASLAIRGTSADPRITGAIERVRGQLSLIGKTFALARGQVQFDGGAKIDPRIDVVLERATADLTGRIVVSGTASNPELSFTSNPVLPEDEVLPRVLFGKSSQALTPSQAVQLGLGLATLMDGSGGTLDAVRGAVGLDQLQIEQDADGNASVAVGKEVAEGVWVGTRQSLGTAGTSVAVEIDVFEDISIDAEVEATGGSSVGVQWKKDF